MQICTLCGFRYDPAQNQVCQSCPLHVGCHLSRCPACGYEEVAVNDKRSTALSRTFSRIKGALRLENR